MKSSNLLVGALALTASLVPFAAHAHSINADDHAPIGVMGDHAHKKGEIMLSARYMHMGMAGNQIGTDDVTPETITTTVPNRFAGMPMQPPTLRVVPEAMRAEMVMIGAMYAPVDAFTLAIGATYVTKETDALTFQGGMGTAELGRFQSSVEGFGDMKAMAIIPLLPLPDKTADRRDELYLKAGFNVPTGSRTKTDEVLTPMGTTMTMRMAYGMQLGTGTWDFEPALTYKARRGKIGYGVQGSASLKLGDNTQGYSFGDIYESTAWVSYRPAQWVSLSARAKARTMGSIDGMDPAIMGPTQGANPDLYGGERVDLLAGVNFVGTHGALAGHRLGIELGKPVYQDLNGPQLASDWSLMIGWQKAW
ncbi:hypothetical protein SAMN06297468_2252 [Altererythrobacter xiamenensis]|uniref:MetA-pathway of phenol degradation n=1 Tax=Altererythrobacter xiamenensis TaxID=1316679 RepID=A0A1Y6FF80_9SPHN|nr:alpha-amylase [Altererythrobacter xiamenensis]SMQ73608.1 hypothetical protein SAMN06297468_2252 [Altererythrobacter xiamenensis]